MKKLIMALLLAAPVPAQADIVRISLNGSLYQVSDSVASRFSLGDAVTAQIILDTDVVPEPFFPGAFLFPGSVLAGFITVDGYTATFGPGARAYVTDDEFGGALDRFVVDDYSAAAADVAGLPFLDLFLNWQDATAAATPGPSLPETQAELDAYGLPTGAIDWLTNDGQNRVTFAASSVRIANALPEPGSWAMMIGGMGVIGGAARRRKLTAIA